MKNILSSAIVSIYIICCFAIRTGPWKYFQLNARHFSREKGIFSKIRIDGMIPTKWRLKQDFLTEKFVPDRFPVFVKPEWGQNATGITRADTPEEFDSLRDRFSRSTTRYIAQEGATESREFEIFTVFRDADKDDCAIITVSEAINQTHEHPINSIHNENTYYHDITDQFTDEQLSRLIGFKQEIGKFGHSRLSVKADSLEDLLAGNFHVIELNLFTPMPINLLDLNYSWMRKIKFILSVSYALAEATRSIDKDQPSMAVYTRMKLYGRSQKTISVLRSFL